jgi:hypothetical protein
MSTKQERTIGFIGETGKRVSSMLQVKFNTDICCVQNFQTKEYRLFAYCTPQLCKRMQDYLDGFKDAFA